MFSTAGATARSGVPGASRATVPMAAITVQAPVLSIFISSIRSADLMLMPPESKHTPLPTIARWRSMASRSPAPPDRHEHAHPELDRALRLDDVDPQVVLLGDGPGLLGEDLRADVVGGAVR